MEFRDRIRLNFENELRTWKSERATEHATERANCLLVIFHCVIENSVFGFLKLFSQSW